MAAWRTQQYFSEVKMPGHFKSAVMENLCPSEMSAWTSVWGGRKVPGQE